MITCLIKLKAKVRALFGMENIFPAGVLAYILFAFLCTCLHICFRKLPKQAPPIQYHNSPFVTSQITNATSQMRSQREVAPKLLCTLRLLLPRVVYLHSCPCTIYENLFLHFSAFWRKLVPRPFPQSFLATVSLKLGASSRSLAPEHLSFRSLPILIFCPSAKLRNAANPIPTRARR